ncbi:molybdate-anion transporter-like isoform X1 [Lingula anatina]|uniref:Molybdate-anion transporter-like isoform X1 n=1 Tax=Lingula anatina TaxID=7574 RepID=A0A1S3K7S6_LINAN|nr:molybdate-anion transporter-like isoform X1 [Lingula anatina]|eukprot:XP_013418311.1 molybdate-anion transporter-like isoform X1 [Lingula anatina]
MSIFVASLWVLVVICVVLFLYTRSDTTASGDASFRSFQLTYLVVYMLAMAGDWLQGPHVYALYQHYGMSTHDIEVLFVAGFGASMIFGTVVGSFADKYGRRANCILYGVLYGMACVTKHFGNFWILMIGRLLGGTATSILYSAFESWLVYEHNKRGFSQDLLGTLFSHATLGNSLVAILAGFVAQFFADSFGFVAPFDVSLTVLAIMCVVIIFTWSENYGDSAVNVRTSFVSAIKSIKSDRKILCLGVIQSLFEGSMYTFVLEWTPALTPVATTASSVASRRLLEEEDVTVEGHRGAIPHGYIFAAFMIAIMIGSSLFKILCRWTSIESFMRPVLFISAVALCTPIVCPGNQLVIFIGFLVFEVCVGLFWPSLGTMRGKYVPEETRATIMNCFRIPLNLIVVIILVQNLRMDLIFKCCVMFLLCACLSQHVLYRDSLNVSKALPETSGEGSRQDAGKMPLIKEDLVEANGNEDDDQN